MFSNTHMGKGWWLDLVADGHGKIGDVVADRIADCSMRVGDDSLVADNTITYGFEVSPRDPWAMIPFMDSPKYVQ